MSKVRRDKHKKLVWFEIWSKKLEKYSNFNHNGPRYRQIQNQQYHLFLNDMKKYEMDIKKL